MPDRHRGERSVQPAQLYVVAGAEIVAGHGVQHALDRVVPAGLGRDGCGCDEADQPEDGKAHGAGVRIGQRRRWRAAWLKTVKIWSRREWVRWTAPGFIGTP